MVVLGSEMSGVGLSDGDNGSTNNPIVVNIEMNSPSPLAPPISNSDDPPPLTKPPVNKHSDRSQDRRSQAAPSLRYVCV